MSLATPFENRHAVDAWDAWYRWRMDGRLCDVSIDATWQRVAAAMAVAEGPAAADWTGRYVEAFSTWQLLPDERLLRDAGTLRPVDLGDAPVAVINTVAFVVTSPGIAAWIDIDRLAAVAELAVRLVDSAARLPFGCTGAVRPRIGLIGLADTLSRLGLPYASDAALRLAERIAGALARGCLQGSVQLATEYAGCAVDDDAAAVWHARAMPADLIRAARRHGARYLRLTAIAAHPRLALLANNVSDALDPKMEPAWIAEPAHPGMDLSLRHRYAPAMAGSAPAVTTAVDTLSSVPVSARVAMRAAMQPWIDDPIGYPYFMSTEPADQLRREGAALCALRGLPAPDWQLAATPDPAGPADGR